MQLTIYRKISILLFFILFFSGCTPEWRHYDNKKFKFSILLPGSWKIEEGTFNTVVMALPVEQKNSVVSNRSINVIVTELSEDFSLDTFFELNKEELQRTLVVDNQIYDGEIYAGPFLGKWIIFEHLLERVRLKTISAVWMKGRRIYTVTCSCQSEDFAKYKPIFDKVLRSLRVK